MFITLQKRYWRVKIPNIKKRRFVYNVTNSCDLSTIKPKWAKPPFPLAEAAAFNIINRFRYFHFPATSLPHELVAPCREYSRYILMQRSHPTTAAVQTRKYWSAVSTHAQTSQNWHILFRNNCERFDRKRLEVHNNATMSIFQTRLENSDSWHKNFAYWTNWCHYICEGQFNALENLVENAEWICYIVCALHRYCLRR